MLRLEDLHLDHYLSPDELSRNNFTSNYATTITTGKIPRIIHQTYKTTNIPSHWAGAQKSCKSHNPSYQYYFWTDSSARDLIRTEFGWFLPTYDGYPYAIQRADALRYFVLWRYGGIYIDLDIACRRSLDPLLAFPAWFPSTWPLGVSNDLIASTPGHPVIMKLALDLQDHNFVSWSKYITVFWSTGPMFVNNILASCFRASHITNQGLHHRKSSNADINRGTSARFHEATTTRSSAPADGVVILPPCMYSTSEHSFFGHCSGSSWHGKDVAFVTWLYKNSWWFSGILMCAVVWAVLRKRRRSYVLISSTV
ncbi:hypothetical protein V496_06139 [Pseudogymnoascus sp. VKM F-4515 (FW-2607)]|nr:hypothetical protein V496_06139 [Pseudogymnoascus sp. VKM F-4515 (FW-2607)]